MFIEINIVPTDRIAEFWLTNKEKQDEQLRLSLKPLFAKYRAQKYTVAMFCSGDGDLTEKTTGLLLRNRLVN